MRYEIEIEEVAYRPGTNVVECRFKVLGDKRLIFGASIQTTSRETIRATEIAVLEDLKSLFSRLSEDCGERASLLASQSPQGKSASP